MKKFAFITTLGIALSACGVNVHTAEQNAMRWGNQMELKPTGVSCSPFDSDGNMYTSCDVKAKDGTVHSVECPYTTKGGCKKKVD